MSFTTTYHNKVEKLPRTEAMVCIHGAAESSNTGTIRIPSPSAEWLLASLDASHR